MSSPRQSRDIKQLEAFHRLSEEIAHDINNLLSGILGYSDLLLIDPAADALRVPIAEISNAGKSIASLIRMLSAFGEKYVYLPEMLDLNEVILGIEGFLPRVLGKEIEFIAIKTPELWPVRVDFVKMKQALITLAVDMKNAMPEGGTLRISVKNLTDAPPGSRLDPGHYVLITAAASGKIAVDEVPESLFGSSSPPNDPAAQIAEGLPSVCDLVKIARGHAGLDICSERELSVSICLPAIHTEPRDDTPQTIAT